MYDCRNINDVKCKYLKAANDKKIGNLPHIYHCKKMNITLFADMRNKDNLNDETLSISPDFNCPLMQKLRIKGLAPKFEYSIESNKPSIYWNDNKL